MLFSTHYKKPEHLELVLTKNQPTLLNICMSEDKFYRWKVTYYSLTFCQPSIFSNLDRLLKLHPLFITLSLKGTKSTLEFITNRLVEKYDDIYRDIVLKQFIDLTPRFLSKLGISKWRFCHLIFFVHFLGMNLCHWHSFGETINITSIVNVIEWS